MAADRGKVLIVDDEPNALRVLGAILTADGYIIHTAEDVPSAQKILAREDLDTVITDIRMPGRDGMYLFQQVRTDYPDLPIIFLTAYGSVESAVEAVTCGAFYYFIKPPDYDKLKAVLVQSVEQRRLKREVVLLKKQLGVEENFRIGGANPSIVKILDIIDSVKDSMSSVLICGETGTGKELIARSLHFGSVRRSHPFVAVNCAAIPRELIESELFGYEKGAFSGATSRRIGRVEEAADGTLFLDEIGELELSLQAKLLRVLQEREIERLGSNKKIKVNFRLVCSTNRDLRSEIMHGNFREDLFYRLNVVQIDVPTLRSRKDDIPVLAADFLKEFSAKEGKVVAFTDQALDLFLAYSWPGNIRQLRNVVERAVVLARGGRVLPEHLPEEVRGQGAPPRKGKTKTLREMEVDAVRKALLDAHGNKSKAAKLLGISRKALYRRLEEEGI